MCVAIFTSLIHTAYALWQPVRKKLTNYVSYLGDKPYNGKGSDWDLGHDWDTDKKWEKLRDWDKERDWDKLKDPDYDWDTGRSKSVPKDWDLAKAWWDYRLADIDIRYPRRISENRIPYALYHHVPTRPRATSPVRASSVPPSYSSDRPHGYTYSGMFVIRIIDTWYEINILFVAVQVSRFSTVDHQCVNCWTLALTCLTQKLYVILGGGITLICDHTPVHTPIAILQPICAGATYRQSRTPICGLITPCGRSVRILKIL